jgi:RNA polymerase sigma-70 factor (ECF subfamily)
VTSPCGRAGTQETLVETELIERARRGDREAFGQLVESRASLLYATAQRILRDTDAAEDATQDALVTAWTKLRRLRDPERFDAWLRRILVHACYDECRRRRVVRAHADRLSVDDRGGDGDVGLVADRDCVEQAFRRLTVEQRAVIVLRYYLALDAAEIGRTLGIPAATVRTRLFYATRAMRAAVEADARPEPVGVRLP